MEIESSLGYVFLIKSRMMNIVQKLNNCRLSLAEIFIFSEIVLNALLIST
jgi:hypothetical protein